MPSGSETHGVNRRARAALKVGAATVCMPTEFRETSRCVFLYHFVAWRSSVRWTLDTSTTRAPIRRLPLGIASRSTLSRSARARTRRLTRSSRCSTAWAWLGRRGLRTGSRRPNLGERVPRRPRPPRVDRDEHATAALVAAPDCLSVSPRPRLRTALRCSNFIGHDGRVQWAGRGATEGECRGGARWCTMAKRVRAAMAGTSATVSTTTGGARRAAARSGG